MAIPFRKQGNCQRVSRGLSRWWILHQPMVVYQPVEGNGLRKQQQKCY